MPVGGSGNLTCAAAAGDGTCPPDSVACPTSTRRPPDDVAVTNGGKKHYAGLFPVVGPVRGLPPVAVAVLIDFTVTIDNGGQLAFADNPQSTTTAVEIASGEVFDQIAARIRTRTSNANVNPR